MSSVTARKVLVCVAIAELLAKSLWFSGTAVIPQLTQEWHSNLELASWLTTSVQLGFVAGALLMAVTNLLDVMSASRVFVISGVLGAIFNAAFAMVAAQHPTLGFFFRFLTGMTAAGVYPTGMKIVTSWFGRERRGLAMGIVVGSLTAGSALPHAVHVGSLPWRDVVYACSVFSLCASALMIFASDGPLKRAQPRFDFRQCTEALRNRHLRLANFGYLGHMWELYSMWGWIAIILAAAGPRVSHNTLEVISFCSIAAGLVGCVWAGYVSDRNQIKAHDETAPDVRSRSKVTIIAMAVSGLCCVLAAIFFDNFAVLAVISIVWGISVVADSAQFSTIVSEVADQRYIGTALTMQTALGFLLTAISIRTVAAIGSNFGWQWAALSMAAGPIAGIVAMTLLHRAPQPSRTTIATAASSSVPLSD